MKKFADLHLRVPHKNMLQAERIIKKASQLGYNLVGIPFEPNASQEQINKVKKVCNEAKLDFVSRKNLAPRNSNELLHDLRRYRRKYEIIAVKCNTQDVARQAAKDRRVDLIQFSVTNIRQRFFNEQEAELASQALSSLEIELIPLLQLASFSRICLLSCLRKEAATAKRKKVPITISSSATIEQQIRGPYDLAALTSLFDLPSDSALKAISQTPLNIVRRNREKLSSDYVAPGIRIIRRRKNHD